MKFLIFGYLLLLLVGVNFTYADDLIGIHYNYPSIYQNSCNSVVKVNCIDSLNDTMYSKQESKTKFNGTNYQDEITNYSTVDKSSKEKYINPNANSYNKNAIANFNITDANQTFMQSYAPSLNPEFASPQFLKEQVVIPVKATDNTSLNIGANKVEFNISY